MLLEDIHDLSISMNERASLDLWEELLHGARWRLYSDETNPEVEVLAKRFITSHARVPGFFGQPIAALRPVEVFGWRGEQGQVRGVLFGNGAAAYLTTDKAQLILLLVDEETATNWGYPDGYIQIGESETDRE